MILGPGLIFVVYPQTMAKMPTSQLWAVFFFFMLICLALNSQVIISIVVRQVLNNLIQISFSSPLSKWW